MNKLFFVIFFIPSLIFSQDQNAKIILENLSKKTNLIILYKQNLPILFSSVTDINESQSHLFIKMIRIELK